MLEEVRSQLPIPAGNLIHLGGAGACPAGYRAYEDLIAAGVVDPAMVTRSALQNAASIGSLIVTTDVVVAEPEDDAPAGMPGGMGGMM